MFVRAPAPAIRIPLCRYNSPMPFVTLDGFARKSVPSVQDYAILSGRAISNLFRQPRYVDDIFTQADIIGVGSLPIVILTGFFTGAVLALQSASLLSPFGATSPNRPPA